MMIAELSSADFWMIGLTGLMAFICLGALIVSIIALNKKQEVQVQQPVTVSITEELHKEFASKAAFERHVGSNDEAHDKLFSKIGGVERGANSSIEGKVEVVRRDLILVGNQVAALKSQTDSQNTQLTRMELKLDRVAERKTS